MKKKMLRAAALAITLVLFMAGCTKTGEIPASTEAAQGTLASEEDVRGHASPAEEGTASEIDLGETEAQPDSPPGTETAAMASEGIPAGTEAVASETEAAATETVQETESETETETETSDADMFHYVAFGNSLTCNEISGFWWGTWGMAASDESKDYVHIVAQWLGGQSIKPVTTTVVSIKDWEMASDRNGVLPLYMDYLDENTNLVTIQTGENITDFKGTLGNDYMGFVSMVKAKAPNAQVLMLAEMLWPSEDIESAKRAACAQYGVEFLDMATFLNGYEGLYKSAMGTVVGGADGGTHAIDNEVVASHPNDEGMACIAQEIINHIAIQH